MANMTLSELKNQLAGLEEYTPETEEAMRARAESIYNPQYQQDLVSLRNSLTTQLNQQSRSAVNNGMQRSSYNQASQASIRNAGLQSEAQLAAAKEGNVANLLYQMLEGEKDRKTTADQYRNQLLMALYEYGKSGSSGGSYTPASTPQTNPDDGKENDKDKDVATLMNGGGETVKDMIKRNNKTSLFSTKTAATSTTNVSSKLPTTQYQTNVSLYNKYKALN